MSIDNMYSPKEVEILEQLAIAANVFQVGSFFMNLQELSNDDLMKALEYQNQYYLETVLRNQEQIFKEIEVIKKHLNIKGDEDNATKKR